MCSWVKWTPRRATAGRRLVNARQADSAGEGGGSVARRPPTSASWDRSRFAPAGSGCAGGRKQRALLARLMLDAEPHCRGRGPARRLMGRGGRPERGQDDPRLRLAAAQGAAARRAAHARARLRPRVGRRGRARPARVRAAARGGPSRPGARRAGSGRAVRATPWRSGAGRPGRVLTSPSRQSERARLEELRLGRLEERIEADLARGATRRAGRGAGVADRGAPAARAPARASSCSRSTAPAARPRRSPATSTSAPRWTRNSASSPRAQLRELELSILRQEREARPDGRAEGGPLPPDRTRCRSSQRRRVRSPTRWSATGRSISCSSTAGSAVSSPAGSARDRALLRAPGRDGAADPLRQAGHRALGPRQRHRVARGAHGRRARRDRRRRLRARGGPRRLRGRPDGGAVRGDLSRTARAALVAMGSFARRMPGAGLPDRTPSRRTVARPTPEEWGLPAARRFLEERAPSVAGDEDAIRWYASYLVRGAQPGRGGADRRDMNEEIDVRHVLPTIHVPRSCSTAPRSTCARPRATWASASRARAWSSCRAPTTCRGRATRTTCSTRSRRSSPTSRTHGRADRVLTTVLARRVAEPRAAAAARPPRALPRPRAPGGDGRPARELRRARARDPVRARDRRSRRGPARRAAAGLHTGECEVARDGLSGIAAASSRRASQRSRRLARSWSPRRSAISSRGSGARFPERGAVALPGADGRSDGSCSRS